MSSNASLHCNAETSFDEEGSKDEDVTEVGDTEVSDAGHVADTTGQFADNTSEIAPSRGEMVGLALQIDAMIARSDEMGLDLVAYLLGVARAELGERLGERRSAAPAHAGREGVEASGRTPIRRA